MIPQAIHDARGALARAISDHTRAAQECQTLLSKLPENLENVPAMECERLLNRLGFAVIHRDHLATLIGLVAVAAEADEHEPGEAEELEKLLAYLEAQFQPVRR